MNTETIEPCGWIFQHDETGRMAFCENDGINTREVFQALNGERYTFVEAAYPASDFQKLQADNENLVAQRRQHRARHKSYKRRFRELCAAAMEVSESLCELEVDARNAARAQTLGGVGDIEVVQRMLGRLAATLFTQQERLREALPRDAAMNGANVVSSNH